METSYREKTILIYQIGTDNNYQIKVWGNNHNASKSNRTSAQPVTPSNQEAEACLSSKRKPVSTCDISPPQLAPPQPSWHPTVQNPFLTQIKCAIKNEVEPEFHIVCSFINLSTEPCHNNFCTLVIMATANITRLWIDNLFCCSRRDGEKVPPGKKKKEK